jgi:UDP-glucose 4-epimerase
MSDPLPPRRVLVTGASGYLGRLVVAALAERRAEVAVLVATDIRPLPTAERLPGVVYDALDVRSKSLADLAKGHAIDTIVHLAAIVTPGQDDDRDRQYSVDVGGTENVLGAAVEAGVGRIVYTSSGAAYGYHPDNRALLDEDDPLRGNEEFAYAWHKRLVEDLLARYRRDHPELGQLVFRVSTILGATVHNQITAMFERPVVLGLRESETPFCFVWDQDVVGAIVAGVLSDRTGVYNLTGDGVMTLREIAQGMGRRYVALPERWVRRGLRGLKRFDLAPYGPEQTLFLRWRPVLSNRRLVKDFGYRPRMTSREVFDLYRRSRA